MHAKFGYNGQIAIIFFHIRMSSKISNI